MVQALHLYVDDSGTRHPDKSDLAAGKDDWFGLGGILVREENEDEVRQLYDAFRNKWQARLRDAPLHSNEIRQRKNAFSWLNNDPNARTAFFGDIETLLSTAPILCTACVIDRPGYRARYHHVYAPEQRWMLCKTAFSVLLERASKYAHMCGEKLRVYVERSDRQTDAVMRGYYDDLRNNGMPFNRERMASYAPADTMLLRNVLYDFKTKDKTSRLMQLADLCLYPICRSGYDRRGRDFQCLVASSRLIDRHLSEDKVATMGIKYSCFDSVTPKVA